MKKLKDLLENVYINGKLPRGCTLAETQHLVDIYNKLVNKESAGFIEQSVYNVLVKCGIKVKPEGIGWRAYR